MLTNAEITQRIEAAAKIRRWYQSVPYGDICSPDQNFSDGGTDARSFGEGRWQNYVKPMIESLWALDSHHSTLCELGCSAGLFLLRAWQEFGFRHLYGIEAGVGAFEQLRITQDYYDRMPLTIYKARVGTAHKDIHDASVPLLDLEHFPIVDITLLSVVHNYIPESELRQYLIDLASKSMCVLILIDRASVGVTSSDRDFVYHLVDATRSWELIHERLTPEAWLNENNMRKRDLVKRLSGLVFVSKVLRRFPTAGLFDYVLQSHKFNTHFYTNIFPQFIEQVLKNQIRLTTLTGTACYQWQMSSGLGSTRWPPEVALERTQSYYNIIKTMADHGQEQPILIHPLGMRDRFDGFHRVAVAQHLGLKYVYGKDLACSDLT